MIFLILSLLLFGYAWLIEPHNREVKRETLQFEDLPWEFNNLKIVFISDLHTDTEKDRKELQDIVKLINAENPDFVLIGGDFADKTSDQRATLQVLRNLQASSGIFAVRGNHDTRAGNDALYNMFREASITPCNNESFLIQKEDASIRIAGVDDFDTNSDARTALQDAQEDEFVIFLAHQPKSVMALANEGLSSLVDVALTGHTHGGQITFFGLFNPMAGRTFPAYTSQWKDIDNVPTLYSNGVGQWFNLRFFARPQIHILTFQTKNGTP